MVLQRGRRRDTARCNSLLLAGLFVVIIGSIGLLAFQGDTWLTHNVLTGAAVSLGIDDQATPSESNFTLVRTSEEPQPPESISLPVEVPNQSDDSNSSETITSDPLLPPAIGSGEDLSPLSSNTPTGSANASECGWVNGSLTLVTNVNSTSSCFDVNSSNVVIDCAGFTINYSNSANGYGINVSSGADNITIKNCVLKEYDAQLSARYAIYFSSVANSTIINNTIFTLGASSMGIYLDTSSNNTIINNLINTSGSAAAGIYLLRNSDNANFIANNIINTSGSAAAGIEFANAARSNILINNTIITYNFYPIYFSGSAGNVNYLIYNTTFGEIRWIDNGTGSFLRNLTFNVTNVLGFGLDRNLFISNGTAALNTSAFSTAASQSTVLPRINSSAQITFRQLGKGLPVEIRRVMNYTTTVGDILAAGINCTGTVCQRISHVVADGPTIFNVTGWSSFAINVSADLTIPTIGSNSAVNITNLNTSQHLRLNVTITENDVDTVRFFVQGMGNLTASHSGSEYYLLCADSGNCNTTRAGTFNWTSTWVNDTSGNTNVSSVDFQFNISYGCGADLNSQYETFTLNRNISGCSGNGIQIISRHTTLNCAGYAITGTKGGDGVTTTGQTASNATIKNCLISQFIDGIDTGSDDVTINNVTVLDTTQVGIRINGVRNFIMNSTILRNNGTYASGDPTTLYAAVRISGNNNTMMGNNISHNHHGILVIGNFGTYSDNFLWNNSNSSYVFWITSTPPESSNNTFTRERIIGNTNGIFSKFTQGTNNTFRDSHFENNSYDAYFDLGTTRTYFFINSTINKSKLYVASPSQAWVKWYIYVNITDQAKLLQSNATVEATNTLNEIDGYSTSSTNGIYRVETTEFYRSNEINYYLTPTSITTYKNNYTRNSTSYDLTNVSSTQFTLLNFTLKEILCGSSITSDADLGNNYNCGTKGFDLGADSITIRGNNINLTGSDTGTGINLSGRNGIQIKDVRITHFARAIDFQQTNNSNLSGLIILNNTYGIIFNSSHNNRIYNSTFDNNTFDVYAINEGETNNSLVNVTIDINNITVEGTATVYLRWYVLVNATINSLNTALAGATANGTFVSSGTLDELRLTDSNGIARLELAELKKNSSEVTYLTPHNVSIQFTLLGTASANYTTINLSQTNSTQVNLHLDLNCTVPSTGLSLSSDTTFCPGTFEAYNMVVAANGVTITCNGTRTIIDTVKQSSSDGTVREGITIDSYNHVSIKYCNFRNANRAVYIANANNITLFNNSFAGAGEGIECGTSKSNNFSNNHFSSNSYGIFLLSSCQDSIIRNNSFYGNVYDIAIGLLSKNNTIHYNLFTSTILSYFLFQGLSSDFNSFNTTLENSSGSVFTQGNKYEDYCGQGTDLNGDGYADNATSASSGDWPYNRTVSSKITDYTSGANANFTDYGPQIHECITEVQVGSSTSSTGGSSSAAAVAAAAVVAPAAPAPSSSKATEEAPSEEVFTNAEDIRKSLKATVAEVENVDGILQVTLSMENIGDKNMLLGPALEDTPEETKFVITRKTVADEGFKDIAGIGYSESAPDNNLLKATLENAEAIELLPGEKKDVALRIDPPELALKPRELKVQLTALGEVVNENGVEVEKKGTIGAALEVQPEKDAMDLYLVVTPDNSEKGGKTNGITGAAIGIAEREYDEYTFEVAVNRKGMEQVPEKSYPAGFSLVPILKQYFARRDSTLFSDVYGPYKVKKGEEFIFSQQVLYDPLRFQGANTVKTKLLKNGLVVAENEFDADLK